MTNITVPLIDITPIIPLGIKFEAAMKLAREFKKTLQRGGSTLTKEDLAEIVPLCFQCPEVRSLVKKKIKDNVSLDMLLSGQKKDFAVTFIHEKKEYTLRTGNIE